MPFQEGDRVSVTFTGVVTLAEDPIDGVGVVIDGAPDHWISQVPATMVTPAEPVDPFDRFRRWASRVVVSDSVPSDLREMVKKYLPIEDPPEEPDEESEDLAEELQFGRTINKLGVSDKALEALHTYWHTKKGAH